MNISVVARILMAEFGWDPAVTRTMLSAFFFGYCLTQLTGGWLADRFGRKGIIGFAVLWWSLATIVTPFASTAPLMLAARIALGVSKGVMPPALHGVTAHWLPPLECSAVITFDVCEGHC